MKTDIEDDIYVATYDEGEGSKILAVLTKERVEAFVNSINSWAGTEYNIENHEVRPVIKTDITMFFEIYSDGYANALCPFKPGLVCEIEIKKHQINVF
jgi:hypothetical protein